MTTVTGTGFVEMRIGKVVAVPGPGDETCFCVLLEGASQDHRMVIEIGEQEAFNLSCSLTGTELARPMSPQFAAGLLEALGGQLRQVRIDRLVPVRDGTAYGAVAEVVGPSGARPVDARPSDALNLAAIVTAPVYVALEVLAEAGARLEADAAEADLLRRAMAAEQVIFRRVTEP
jgi:bifunctional DNase/RNase